MQTKSRQVELVFKIMKVKKKKKKKMIDDYSIFTHFCLSKKKLCRISFFNIFLYITLFSIVEPDKGTSIANNSFDIPLVLPVKSGAEVSKGYFFVVASYQQWRFFCYCYWLPIMALNLIGLLYLLEAMRK